MPKKIVREFTTTAVINDSTNTDREIKLIGQVLETEEIVLHTDDPDVGSFDLTLGHAALAELRRAK